MSNEIKHAEVNRAIQLVTQTWETEVVSADDMCAQMDALCNLVEEGNFADFVVEAELTGRERLN